MANSLRKTLKTAALSLLMYTCGCEKPHVQSQEHFYGTFRGYDVEATIKSDSSRFVKISRGARSVGTPSYVAGYDKDGNEFFEDRLVGGTDPRINPEILNNKKDRLVSLADFDSLSAAYKEVLKSGKRVR